MAETITNYVAGKTALITGASSGIGMCIAERLLACGVNLILISRRTERLLAFQSRFATSSLGSVDIFTLDVRDRAAVADFTQTLLASRQVDILINNAGLALGMSPLDEGKVDQWETMLDTNVKGLLYITRPIMHQMRERNTGHIVHLGSVAGKTAYPGGNVYCATKAAVKSLGEAMNADLMGTLVKVTTIAPGAVETEFSTVRFSGDNDKADAVYAGYAPLLANDVAESILHVLNTPPHVSIQYLDIMPTAQRNPYLLARDK